VTDEHNRGPGGIANALEQLVNQRVATDPVTAALVGPLRAAVRAELAEHLPRVAYKTQEVAEMLGGISTTTVCELVTAGRLRRIAGPQSPITIGSILELVGWPAAPASAGAPLASVPALGSTEDPKTP